MTIEDKPDVAILGGGMAGLTTAWRLTDPDVRSSVGSVTVYQRGHRLGGKGASSRGLHGRIEEHGLHIWLGYYDNAFRLIRECYDELDRPTEHPESPIKTWRDAFAPAPDIGLEEPSGSEWNTWLARFSTNERLPGEPLHSTEPTTVVEMLRRSLNLVFDYYQSLSTDDEAAAADSLLAATAIGAATGAATVIASELRRIVPWLPTIEPMLTAVDSLRASLTPLMRGSYSASRLWHLIDIVTVQIRGIIRDDLIRRDFSAVDHMDYRSWLASHGAAPETLDGPLVRGVYNLAFSHQGGDPTKTVFPAGLGVFLSMKTFFDYSGSIFWKMQAGMGDTVMAPLYQALRRRGVDFQFFHRVSNLHVSADGSTVDAVSLGRQVRLADDRLHYDPLTKFDGLASFPNQVDLIQVDADEQIMSYDLESFWCRWPDAENVRLERGKDYDELVLAIPVGMAPHIASELIESNERWRLMVDTMTTVATQAFQLWLRPSEEDLGWGRPGATITNFVDTFDTWASMSHLLEHEQWPSHDHPGSLAYFCSTMAMGEPDDPSDPTQPGRLLAKARSEAIEYLENSIMHYWPKAVDDEGNFRWGILCGSESSDSSAFSSQFLTANVDPSDRYVQSTPRSARARLRPDQSGFTGLHLAGDWTDCGLNAGCIEAAVLSGIQAANSVLNLPRSARISGGYLL